MDTNKPLLVTGRQLSRLLQVGEGTVKQLAEQGRIPYVDVTPRTRRYDPDAVLEALRSVPARGQAC